jgi:DNA-binding transcriptional regulator YhcF (GntR family)
MVDWSGRPAYAQVADELRRQIRTGQLPPGSQLPSYQALVKRFEVSITAVRSGVRELKTERLVSTHQEKAPLSAPALRKRPDRTCAPSRPACERSVTASASSMNGSRVSSRQPFQLEAEEKDRSVRKLWATDR